MKRGYSLIIVWANFIITASAVATDYADIKNYTSKVVASKNASQADKVVDPLTRITQDNRADFIFEHNAVRSSTDPKAIDMVFMVWALRLERYARAAVSDCAFKDSMNVDELKDLSLWFSSGGLNSWYGAANESLNVSAVVGSWSVEKNYFDYEHLGCELGRKCMHYAQIVWATASHVGCSLKFCEKFTDQGMNQLNNIHYVICMYGEGESKIKLDGDYKKPYAEGNESCSQCPTGFSKCRTGLCDTNPSCETVVDCTKLGVIDLCLCEESVYAKGQRSIVPVWKSVEAVIISVIFLSSSGYDFS